MKRLACCLGVCFFAATAQGQEPPKAALRGRVTNRIEVPLAGVEVRVLGDSIATTTDSAGRFVLRGVPSGGRVVLVRRIGYLPQYLSAVFRPGENREVTVVLSPGAYQLPDVDVSAVPSKPLEYAYTSKYDEFFRRRRIGLGQYISREDIERRTVTQTPELLFGVRGLLVNPGAPDVRPSAIKVPGCHRIAVWVDGVELRPFTTGGFGRPMVGDPNGADELTGEMLERILPIQIEMIEVYTRPSQMPAETVGTACAAIMIWTR